MDLKKQILVALGLDKEEVNLEFQAKLVDGTIIVSTADELAPSVDIAVLTEDGTTILLPVGEYKTEDGVTFTVEEEGVIAAIGEAEEVKEEVEEEVEASEELAEDDGEGMEKRIQNLEDAVADLKEKLGSEDKEEEVEEEEMTEETTEPSTNPKSIKTTEVVEFSAEEEIEKLKAENEKLKTELASQPAATSVNTNKFSADRKEVKMDTSKMSKRERILYNITNN